VFTTMHLRYEQEAADVLGLPFEKYTQIGLLPVAFHTGTTFKPASRLDVSDVLHWNSW
jgi:hypothetical protein